jgi:uncharacterized protein
VTAERLHVVRHATPEQFLTRAGPWLEEAESEHCLFFSICTYLMAHPEHTTSPPHLVTVEREGIRAAALQTAGRKWVLSRSADPALEALVEHLWEQRWPVPGALGPADAARTFTALWSRRSVCAVRPGKVQRIYELRRVIPAAPSAGRARYASAADRGLASTWARAFAEEVQTDETPDENAALIERMLMERRLHLWEDDGGVVSMAGETASTPHGCGVTAVYTPPELRGRGYATSLVAAVSERILRSGKVFCFLFTDLANPTSNSIYPRVGYRPVADWADYFFG